ncbi:MAG: phage baseplate assembly protein V [Bryobacteraceae bacterium]
MLDYLDGRFFGKYRGIVTDNNDPTGRGRLEVLVPAVMSGQPVWAMPCVPYAGKNMGLYAIPEKGTGVWIEFEAGNTSYPIWVGCFWGDGQAPRNAQDGESKPALKILRTEKGLMLTLDDSAEVITLSDSSGANVISIEAQQGKITIKGTSKVVVDAPQIELVENASHPVVFGDNLIQYLNQLVALFQVHTHIPPTMLPVPVMPPATPALLSFKVKTG